MTEVARDESAECPEFADAITNAICALAAAVMDATETGTPERDAAMREVLAAAGRIRAALHRPRLN